MTLSDKLQILSAVLLVIASLAYFTPVHEHNALASEFKEYRTNERIKDINSRLWQLEERNRTNNVHQFKSARDRKEYKELLQSKEYLQKQLDKYMRK